MGAALHLAHAHQAPPGPKRKRGGGGGGGYDQFVARVYADDRHTPESRELILCLAWLLDRDPARLVYDDPDNHSNIYDRANRILGFDATKTPRLARLICDDTPRYEPDKKHSTWDARCNAPMIRRAGQCGHAPRGHSFRIDPDTGWHTPIWYCNRHRDFGATADAALRAAPKPEPIPNTGGLLPSYLEMRTGDDGWARLYEWGSRWCRYRWTRPTKYGLRADDWPRPDRAPIGETERPVRLRLAAMDGELVDP